MVAETLELEIGTGGLTKQGKKSGDKTSEVHGLYAVPRQMCIGASFAASHKTMSSLCQKSTQKSVTPLHSTQDKH